MLMIENRSSAIDALNDGRIVTLSKCEPILRKKVVINYLINLEK